MAAIVDSFLKSDVEEGFHCQIVYTGVDLKQKEFSEKIDQHINELVDNEAKENFTNNYLLSVSGTRNRCKQKVLLGKLQQLVIDKKILARTVCEQILLCEGLKLENKHFWIESFGLIKNILSQVDYKGVREVMKGCREKTMLFPKDLNSNLLPLMKAVVDVLEYIFDRNSCLLPAYFIINEIQKSDNSEIHWMIQKLIAEYVEQFVDMAQMLTIIGYSEKLPIVEHSGSSEQLTSPWKLEPVTLRWVLKGALPFNQSLLQPQTKLLRFVLEQPYSRDFVCSMLNLSKNQRTSNIQLEQNLIYLIIAAMERSESHTATYDENHTIPQHWLHLSSQLIYFVLFQFATFPNIVTSLCTALSAKDLRRGRDNLMWVLLQFISGSIQRNPLQNFLPVLKLFDILYPEKEPLPLPPIHHPSCTHQMAATCIWIHLGRRAQSETSSININRTVPIALKLHYEYLQQLAIPSANSTLSLGKDYSVALLCNAYSTNQDYFSRPMGVMIDSILGASKNISSTPLNPSIQLPSAPLSMNLLDSLTVHSKMSLIHSIVTHMIKQAQTKTTMSNNSSNMAPALVETYSRLLVYTEIESLGIKGFLTQLLPAVFKSQAWSILYTLLEMFSFRFQFQIQPHYRVQLLTHLHSIASQPLSDRVQLHLCIESTALRLISGLASTECRFLTDPKSGSVVSNDSEELNRVLVLTLARSMHITGTGNDANNNCCKDLLTLILQNTPHTWNSFTLNCFPSSFQTFYSQQTNVTKESKSQIKKSVDEEYRNWMSMGSENDILTHFSTAGAASPLCLALKMLIETDKISPIVFKVLEISGARKMCEHLRKMCDYLIAICTVGANASSVLNKYVESVNALIWKYNVITIDRFVLSMILRPHEGNEIQICFYIIQILVLKTPEFRNRVQEFVKENSPDHWKQSNWYEKHMNFHKNYPERFSPDENAPQLPVYFGNVCLRFLPVLDIVIHRYLEISTNNISKILELLIDNLGCLYKFHDRPITYLYNTLHYYESILRDRPLLKKKLVGGIIGPLYDVYPSNWALSESYRAYSDKKGEDENLWVPKLTYYIGSVRRLMDTIDGKAVFSAMDWRFNEFPNSPTHALYVTCVELLSLPVAPKVVANNLIDVIVKGHLMISPTQVHSWINAVGLIISRLPESFWSVIFEKVQDVMNSANLIEWDYNASPFTMFNFDLCSKSMLDKYAVNVLAIAQSVFHHFGPGQISQITEYVNKLLKPIIKSEIQLIYLCHLVGPFLQRLETEIPRAVMDLTVIFYDVLEQVDRANPNTNLKYIDPVCDLLYHLKYQYVGDSMKTDVEAIIKRLRQPLRMKLRFITRLQADDLS